MNIFGFLKMRGTYNDKNSFANKFLFNLGSALIV